MLTVALKKGEEWRSLRSILTPAFSGSRLKRMLPIINSCCRDFVSALAKVPGQEVDIKRYSGNYTTDVMGRAMFGITINCQENLDCDFVRYSKRAFENYSFSKPLMLLHHILPACIGTPLYEAMNWGMFEQDILDFYRRTIPTALKRRETGKAGADFTQLLLEAHNICDKEEPLKLSIAEDKSGKDRHWRNKKRPITEDEILSNSVTFLLGGFETTAAALAWMLHLLAFHQDVQDRLAQEVAAVVNKGDLTYEDVSSLLYLDQVFCETLRLYPSILRADRVCNSTTTVGGFKVREGELVHVSIQAVHRDPVYWPNPHVFDPERFSSCNKKDIVPYTYLPFGIGPRNCIGMRLSILEAKMAVAHLLPQFRFTPASSSQRSPELANSGFASTKSNRLPLIVKMR